MKAIVMVGYQGLSVAHIKPYCRLHQVVEDVIQDGLFQDDIQNHIVFVIGLSFHRLEISIGLKVEQKMVGEISQLGLVVQSIEQLELTFGKAPSLR